MKSDYFSEDVLDFLRYLNKENVQYVIVGGEAAIYYGSPRLTGDIDLFYNPSANNSKQLFKALNSFWDKDIPGITSEDDLAVEGYIIQFGVPPNRIDLISSIDGVEFDEAWSRRKKEKIQIKKGESISIYFIGLDQLIRNKEAANRAKDREDLKYLKKES